MVKNKGAMCKVLYQAHLSEVFVLYMDPDIGWFWRTYMESGKYGFGVFMCPLTVEIDCPSNATYVGANFTMTWVSNLPFPILSAYLNERLAIQFVNTMRSLPRAPHPFLPKDAHAPSLLFATLPKLGTTTTSLTLSLCRMQTKFDTLLQAMVFMNAKMDTIMDDRTKRDHDDLSTAASSFDQASKKTDNKSTPTKLPNAIPSPSLEGAEKNLFS
jgi:hypothetical protein